MLKRRSHRTMLLALIMLIVTSLACSLSTGDTTPQPIATTAGPTQLAQTLPPVAMVTPSAAASPTATTTTVPPTETPPSGTGPGGCVLKEEYVADVTIPDNTVLAPGAAFLKTWRVKNTGTCTWDTTYQLVFADGNQMGGPAGVNVNSTAPNATVDISVNLLAPTTSGTHTARWRLKASNGAIFGGVTVVIVVPATPTPTATITPTVSTGIWNGHWETNCAVFGCGAMELVQKGGVVTGTFGVSGTINATAIGNRLTGAWTNGGSAGSIDWWMGTTNVRWRGNYDAINAWCGHRTGEVDPTPCGVGTFASDWNVLCVGCDGPMKIDQDGRNFTGTYANGTVEGTIDGATATGTWRKTADGTTGTFTWYLINGQQFNGNYGGTNQWCGYRSGSGAPSPCLKP